MTVYPVSPDRAVQVVTMLTVGLLTAVGLGFAGMAAFSQQLAELTGVRVVFLVVALFCLGMVAGCWAYRPAGYALSERALLVQRRAGDVVLPLDQISDVREDPQPFAGAIRVAGNGGLFGFWGRFRSQRLGSFTAYATRQDRGVALEVGGKRIVLTPDDPERLTADVRRQIGRRAG
jgi:hypothetical protein